MKKIIILDFDGTIIDSAPIIQNILNDLRAQRNLNPLELFQIRPWISEGGRVLISECLSVNGEDIVKWVKEFRRLYQETNTPSDLVYPWVKEFLNYAITNSYELAICSNKPEKLLDKALEDTNMKSFFSAVVGTSKFVPTKPNPSGVNKILEKCGYANYQAFMIGDSMIDKQTCINAGVDFVFFEGGYNDGVFLDQTNYSFKNFAELKMVIECELNAVDFSAIKFLTG